MGLKVLVTLDLVNATSKQRDIFYEVLKEEKWAKIKALTTVWKISFNDESTRVGVIGTVRADIKKAKNKSSVEKVEYAFQMDTIDITEGNI